MLSTPALHGVDEIGPYQVLQDLGAAPFGTVYLTVDSRSDRPALLKVIPPSRPGFEQEAAPWEIVLRETQALFRIYHRGIPALYEIAEHEGALLVAFETVDGVILHDLLARGERLERARLVDWGCQLLDILGEAHAQGILHRHLGEDQIVVAPDGHLVLTGFGLTPIFFGPLTSFPPKHTLDEPWTVQSDLYAVGLLLRRLAFASGKSRGSTQRDPLLKVLARATYPDAAARYQDAAEMSEALRQAAQTGEAAPRAAVLRREAEASAAGKLAGPRVLPVAALPVRNGSQSSEESGNEERKFALLLVATALLLMLSVIAAGWLLIGQDPLPETRLRPSSSTLEESASKALNPGD